MNAYKKWHESGHTFGERALMLGLGAAIFPLGIPAILVFLLPAVDRWIGVGSFYSGIANIAAGAVAILLGGILAIWTIIAQMQLASGTPFPMLPTRKLIIVGPYRYCRNPMTLGTIVAYSGIGIWVGSYTAMLAVLVFSAALIAYLKVLEEKELEMRFGRDYVEYKKVTPFLLPRVTKVKAANEGSVA